MKASADKRTNYGSSGLIPCTVILAVLLTAIAVSVFSPGKAEPLPEAPVHTETETQTVSGSSLPEDEQVTAEAIPEETNPIDMFFDTYSLDDSTSSNAHMTSYNAARTDAWLAEVEHGYALMKSSINPAMEEEGRKACIEQIDRSRESFLQYAEESTYLEAAAAAGDDFAPDAEDYFGFYGTAFGGYRLRLKGELYRTEALRIYSMLEYICGFEEISDAFVFDAEEFLSSVTEKYGIVLTNGSGEDGQ